MDEFKDPNFKFVVLEVIRDIGKIAGKLGTRTAQGMDNYYALTNYLEILLIPWIKIHAPAQYKKYNEEIEELKPSDPDISMDYLMVNKKLEILITIVYELGWGPDTMAVGK